MKRAAILVLSVLVPATAAAYSVSLTGGNTGNIVKWPTGDLTYYLHPDCSTDLNAQACNDQVRASFAEWEKPACTSISFGEQGFSSNKALTAVNGGTNNKNEIAWIENNAWFYGTYTLGVTAPWFSQDGVVFEADIAMNGYLQTWSMSGGNYTTDVKNVAVHEIGHFFGMQHVLGGYSQNDPPTMAPTADPFMQSQTPNTDDLDGVCFLYPQGPWSCSSNDDCPFVNEDGPQGEFYAGVLSCSGGSCGGFSNQLPEGDGQMGESCVSDVDCEQPLFCQPLQGGYGACATQCQTASPGCPGGFDCVPYSNSPGNGVCLEGQGGGGGSAKANGESCSSSQDCESFLCVTEQGGGVCRQQCFSSGQCPQGEECMPLSGVNYGACFPGAGGGGDDGKAIGEPCGSGDECASSLCAGSDNAYLCTQPCINSSQCPDGQQCYGLSGGGGGCFGDTGGGGAAGLAVGDVCEYSDQCISQQCVSLNGGAPFCTDDCAAASDCPCGMACVQVQGGEQICAPGEPVGCLDDGAECTADAHCTSGLCHQGTCATACAILDGAAVCPAGTGCQRTGAGSLDGICKPVGGAAVGDPCQGDGACQSLFCNDGTCAQPCNPAGPSCTFCTPISEGLGVCSEPDPGGGDDTVVEPGGDPTGDDTAITGGEGSGDGPPPGERRAVPGPFGCAASHGIPTPPIAGFVLLLFAVLLATRKPRLRA